MGITLDYGRARARLLAAIDLAESERPVPAEWEERVVLVGEAPARTYTPMLGTGLLARATDDRIDALALKETSGANAYSARGLAHEVLVPASVERRFDIRTTGREPLNNQPFFRYDRVDGVERVRFAQAHRYLVECLGRANELAPEEALAALAAFLRVCFRRARSAAHANLLDVSVGLRAGIEAARTLLAEGVEGGKRAQALTAAAFDGVYGADRVRTLLVNDPSRHFPGDVQALDDAGRPVVSAEVRAKPMTESEIEQFARALDEAGITRGMVVTLAPDQPDLPYAEIAERVARERGVLMVAIDSVDDLLLSAFAWSTRPLSEVLAEFPARVGERLRGIDADAATIRRWEELVQPIDASITGSSPVSGSSS